MFAQAMTESDLDTRYDDIDVESILARCERRGPLTFSRKRCLYQAPEFIQRLPAEETVEEGSTIAFECKVVGFPNPTLTWYKGDIPIGPESRAKTRRDIDSGIYSLEFTDVSKCDAGTYKVCASNLEGSSTSSLFITVQAKNKFRKGKKQKKNHHVTSAPLFPDIVELDAEERKETLEVELQPDSPLTPLYCNISKRPPKMWPAFLGDWAYNTNECLRQDDRNVELEYEDVFEMEINVFIKDENKRVNTKLKTLCDNNIESISDKKRSSEINVNIPTQTKNQLMDNRDQTKGATGVLTKASVQNDAHNEYSGNVTDECNYVSLNNNNYYNNNNINKNSFTSKECSGTNNSNANDNAYQCDHTTRPCNLDLEVSAISVNRSYAKGNSTFSVAKRRSPILSTAYNQVSYSTTVEHAKLNVNSDSIESQNSNKEKSLYSVKRQYNLHNFMSTSFVNFVACDTYEDHLGEVLLLLCVSTFLALILDLAPATFVISLIVALAIKYLLVLILNC